MSDYSHGWGYNNQAISCEELAVRYEELICAIRDTKAICGFCYTQLTDVMQEVNGLLDQNHQPKLDVYIIKRINEAV